MTTNVHPFRNDGAAAHKSPSPKQTQGRHFYPDVTPQNIILLQILLFLEAKTYNNRTLTALNELDRADGMAACFVGEIE